MTGYEKALRYAPPLDPYLAGLVKLENVSELLEIIRIIYCGNFSINFTSDLVIQILFTY